MPLPARSIATERQPSAARIFGRVGGTRRVRRAGAGRAFKIESISAMPYEVQELAVRAVEFFEFLEQPRDCIGLALGVKAPARRALIGR